MRLWPKQVKGNGKWKKLRDRVRVVSQEIVRFHFRDRWKYGPNVKSRSRPRKGGKKSGVNYSGCILSGWLSDVCPNLQANYSKQQKSRSKVWPYLCNENFEL